MLQESCQSSYFESGIDAVECGRGDTSGVAGSFTAGVETGCGDGLKGLGITRDTHGAAASALDTEDDCLVGEEARVFLVEVSEALLEAFSDMRGQPEVKAGGDDTRQVTARREVL